MKCARAVRAILSAPTHVDLHASVGAAGNVVDTFVAPHEERHVAEAGAASLHDAAGSMVVGLTEDDVTLADHSPCALGRDVGGHGDQVHAVPVARSELLAEDDGFQARSAKDLTRAVGLLEAIPIHGQDGGTPAQAVEIGHEHAQDDATHASEPHQYEALRDERFRRDRLQGFSPLRMRPRSSRSREPAPPPSRGHPPKTAWRPSWYCSSMQSTALA